MANERISEMPIAPLPLTGTEKVEIVLGGPGSNRQTTTQDIANLGGGGGGTITSVNGDTGPAVVLTASDVGADASGAASAALTSANGYTDTQIATEVTNRNNALANKVSISGAELHATASGTNTYTATLSPTPSYASGLTVRIKFTNGNTGASTINLNSLGAKSIKKNVSTDLASGDIPAGAIVEMVYDGTNFQAIGIVTSGGSATWGSITGTLSSQSDLNTALTARVLKAGDTMTGDLAFGGTQKNTGLAAGTAAGDSLRYEQVYLIPTTPTVTANAFTWDCGGLMNPEADVSISASATMTMTNIKAGSSGILRVAIGTASQVNLTFATTGGLTHKSQNTTFTVFPFPLGNSKEYYITFFTKDGTTIEWVFGVPAIEAMNYALSDEITPLTTGVKLTDRMPYAFYVTSVRISLTTAQTTSVFVTVDVKKNGVSILSTLVSVDNNEKTSVTAAYPVVISTPDFADDDEVQFSVTQVGTATVAAGLKCKLIGYKI